MKLIISNSVPLFIRRPGNFIIGLLLLSVLLLIALISHFNGLYGQDAHEYLRLSRTLNNYFKSGEALPHSYFPILFPFIGLAITKIIQNDIVSLQIVSMISLVLSFFYVKKLAQLIFEERRFLNAYLVCFLFLSPYVFRFALLSMSDMLCMFFVIACTYHTIRFSILYRLKDAGASAFFMTCAIETRYAVVIMLLFPAFILMRSIVRKKNWRAGSLALLMAAVPVSIDLLIRQRLFFFDLSTGKLLIDYASNAYAWSPLNFFRNVFVNPDGNQHYDFWNIVTLTFSIIHPGFFFPGLLVLFFVSRKDLSSPATKMLVTMIIVYGLFLSGLNYQNNRYLLQSFPFVIVLFYPSFIRIAERFLTASKIRTAFFIIVILIQQALFWYSFQSVYQMNQTEQEIASSLQAYSNRTVYTCSITGALNSYRVSSPITDMYFEQVSAAKPNSLLLFNYNQFSEHFKNQLPMINWKFLNEHYRLEILRSYPKGWSLYSINERPVPDYSNMNSNIK